MNMDIKLSNGDLWFADTKVKLDEPMIGDKLRHNLFVVRQVGDYPAFVCGLDIVDDGSSFWLGLNSEKYDNFSEVKAILDAAYPDGWHVYEEDYSIIASLGKFSDPADNAKYFVEYESWGDLDDES